MAYSGNGHDYNRGIAAFAETYLDAEIGAGFFRMLADFESALQTYPEECDTPSVSSVGFTVRSRDEFCGFWMDFLICGRDVIYLKTEIHDEDPVWEILRSTGIEQLVWLPCLPVEDCEMS